MIHIADALANAADIAVILAAAVLLFRGIRWAVRGSRAPRPDPMLEAWGEFPGDYPNRFPSEPEDHHG